MDTVRSCYDTNDLTLATTPYARVRSNSIETSTDAQAWEWLGSRPQTNQRLIVGAAAGDAIIVADPNNVWTSTNRVNWTKVLTGIGPDLTTGGSDEIFPQTPPWISSIASGSNLVVVGTTWGELLFTRDGFNWHTNQTPFTRIFDVTITPRGIMVASYDTIAESFFEAAPDTPAQFGFIQRNREFLFTGEFAHFEIQTKTNLLDPWQPLTQTTNTLPLSTSANGATFYRAVKQP